MRGRVLGSVGGGLAGPPWMRFVVLFLLLASPTQRVFESLWEPSKQGQGAGPEVVAAVRKAGCAGDSLQSTLTQQVSRAGRAPQWVDG